MIFTEPIPREVDVLESTGRASKRWLLFFEQFVRFFTLTEAAHTDRLDAAKAWHGTWLYETDRTVLYQCRIISGVRTWIYVSGTMRAELANKPTDLGTNDAGFLFHATDFVRTWRWTGSAWEYAPGERLAREIIWYPGTLPAAGWALCDGSTTIATTATATAGLFVTPDLTGQFVKGGAYSGSVVSAVMPALSGTTGADGDHDHGGLLSGAVNVAGESITGGGVGGVQVVGAEGSQPFAVSVTGSGTHTHDAGTLALSGSLEPSHVLLLPIVKL